MTKSFITLADVKINNSYTYYRAVAPTVAEKAPTYANGETWLDTVTGYSYELIDETLGTWERIETDLDARINYISGGVFLKVITYINNFFAVPRVLNYYDNYDYDFPDGFTREDAFTLARYESVYSAFTFDATAGTISAGSDVYGSLTDTFAAGDTVFIAGTRRNSGYYTITNVTASALTVSEDLADETAPSFLLFADVPAPLIAIIANMVYYDVYKRGTAAGLKSERVGTYSYTRADDTTGLGYPDDVTAGLAGYIGIEARGGSYFVN